MAKYRQLIVEGEHGWYLMNPSNLFEALRIAWMLWRNPDRVGALIAVDNEWAISNMKPDSAAHIEGKGER